VPGLGDKKSNAVAFVSLVERGFNPPVILHRPGDRENGPSIWY